MTSQHRTLYLCPSDRAARAFRQQLKHKPASKLAGDGPAAPDCVDFERYCATLWRRGQLFGLIADSRELLDASAAASLWRSVVADEASLMAAESARVASLADDAWALAHRYGLSVAQIASLASGHDNQALFARCAARMESLLRRVGAITQPELYAQLRLRIDAIRSLLPDEIVLTPSFNVHRAQTLFLSSLSERGVGVTHWAPEVRAPLSCRAYEVSDEQQEMLTAIAWAKERTRHSPDGEKVIAIIVPNLSQCRASWLTALREQLNPEQWWLSPDTDREQFNLSIGEPLSASPWVASLLTVLGATVGSIDTEVLAQALMHPRWGLSPLAQQRVQIKLWRMLERGCDRCTLAEWMAEYAPPVRADWDEFFSSVAEIGRSTRASHQASLLAMVEALTEHPLIAQSDLFQLQKTWSDALRQWVDLDRWLPTIHWRDAVREIASMAAEQTFQPESGSAKIQVMGLLESAGVALDAAWIVGLTDRVLPETFKPHPMLPRAWQAAQHVGLGSRDEVRRRADALWENWNLLCPELHVSYAKDVANGEGSAQAISALARAVGLEPAPSFDAPSDSAPDYMQRLDISITSDEVLPELVSSSARPPLTSLTPLTPLTPLTSSIVEQQAHCPRKAAASRLNLREWPEYAVGIPARLRGEVVHHVMHSVGKTRIQQTRDTGDDPTLHLLRAVAAEAFDVAVTGAHKKRPAIPAAVWAIERDRLLPLIDKVLALDAKRIGFTVVAVEEGVQAEAFNTAFKLRLDRRDLFAAPDSSERYGVVLDYKTGGVLRADWFAEHSSGRLAAPQLPLYVFALHAALPDSEPRIGALGYVVISDDDVKFVGVGADPAFNAPRSSPSEADWPALMLAWRDQLAALVEEHRAGVAAVAPLKGALTCRYCAYAGFCREPWSLSGMGERADDDALSETDAAAATDARS